MFWMEFSKKTEKTGFQKIYPAPIRFDISLIVPY